MRWTFRSVGIALAIAASAMPGSAQQRSDLEQENNIPYGTRSGEFLLLPVGGRATAMGSAFTALANDISSLYWNPAGAAQLENRAAMLSYIDYLVDTRHIWAGFATPIGGDRVIGFQVGTFGFSDQPEYTVEQPDGTGRTYSVSMTNIGVTFAQQFTDRFGFGITGKMITENLAGPTGSTWGVDFGTNYTTQVGGRTIRGAFTITNLGGTLKHSGSELAIELPEQDPNLPPGTKKAQYESKAWDLPVAFRVGVAYDALSSATNRLTMAGEFAQPSGNDVTGAVGAEYALTGVGNFTFAARAGFNYESDNGIDSQQSRLNGAQGDGISFGGGIDYAMGESGGVGVDYAWRNKGLLGNQHLFSFAVRF